LVFVVLSGGGNSAIEGWEVICEYTDVVSGNGKTYLAKIIAWRACQANQRVLFTTAMDMLNHLLASQVDHSLIRKLKIYIEPALLVVDELGYLSLDQQTSNLFYQVISKAALTLLPA
jgi:DNA replication protein DnaC